MERVQHSRGASQDVGDISLNKSKINDDSLKIKSKKSNGLSSEAVKKIKSRKFSMFIRAASFVINKHTFVPIVHFSFIMH